jgi:TrwC relaxase
MHQWCVCSRQRRREGSGAVVADIAKLSVGREEYYTRELATDHEQYLSGHGESPGRWNAAGATTLGLQGEASPAAFQALFEGRDPTTEELLGRPHGPNAVPAFDVVLRPTKSVSILYGLGDPATGRAVLEAHHAGLAEAVAYLDEHLGARRGHGGVQHVSGQGLLAVGFDHRTSREGDPLLHTHLVIANRVQGAGRPLDSLGRPRPIPASAGRGRHLPGYLPARACPDTGGGVDGRGRPREPGAGRHAGGAGAGLLQAHRPNRCRTRPAGRGRWRADTAARLLLCQAAAVGAMSAGGRAARSRW